MASDPHGQLRAVDDKPLPFPVGSVVWLKSGSPPMTVTTIAGGLRSFRNTPLVDVEWFAGDKLCRDSFLAPSLTTDKPT